MMIIPEDISPTLPLGLKVERICRGLIRFFYHTFSDTRSVSDEKEARFAVLIRQYAALINRICFTYSDNAEDMKDLRQDVYVNIWKGLATFRMECSETTWIYRVVLNTCVSTIRKKKRRVSMSSFDALLTEVPDESQNDDYKEKMEELHFLISRLSPLDKAIITMWLDERSYEEIAAVCGLNRNTLAVRINRIKTKLKNNYEL